LASNAAPGMALRSAAVPIVYAPAARSDRDLGKAAARARLPMALDAAAQGMSKLRERPRRELSEARYGFTDFICCHFIGEAVRLADVLKLRPA
jgi:hypothetical protein